MHKIIGIGSLAQTPAPTTAPPSSVTLDMLRELSNPIGQAPVYAPGISPHLKAVLEIKRTEIPHHPSIIKPQSSNLTQFIDEFLLSAELAALGARTLTGMGTAAKQAIDAQATKEMDEYFKAFSVSHPKYTLYVTAGEGAKDESYGIFTGRQYGNGSIRINLLLDPVDGTTPTSKGNPLGTAMIYASIRDEAPVSDLCCWWTMGQTRLVPPDADMDADPSKIKDNVRAIADAVIKERREKRDQDHQSHPSDIATEIATFIREEMRVVLMNRKFQNTYILTQLKAAGMTNIVIPKSHSHTDFKSAGWTSATTDQSNPNWKMGNVLLVGDGNPLSAEMENVYLVLGSSGGVETRQILMPHMQAIPFSKSGRKKVEKGEKTFETLFAEFMDLSKMSQSFEQVVQFLSQYDKTEVEDILTIMGISENIEEVHAFQKTPKGDYKWGKTALMLESLSNYSAIETAIYKFLQKYVSKRTDGDSVLIKSALTDGYGADIFPVVDEAGECLGKIEHNPGDHTLTVTSVVTYPTGYVEMVKKMFALVNHDVEMPTEALLSSQAEEMKILKQILAQIDLLFRLNKFDDAKQLCTETLSALKNDFFPKSTSLKQIFEGQITQYLVMIDLLEKGKAFDQKALVKTELEELLSIIELIPFSISLLESTQHALISQLQAMIKKAKP